MASNWKLPLGVEEIKKILPHRYPFLFVDKITELEPMKRAVGYKLVSYNEYFFQGHFPEVPIMPGVLILEAIAQVGGVMTLAGYEKPEDYLPVLASLEKVKFKKPVKPGDLLRIETELAWQKMKAGKVIGKAFVGDELVAELSIIFSLVPREKLLNRE